ncbi:MAG: sodium-dependent transporter [Gemmatimonadetes bacterium]|nr:sodium-dependent transporter [Gemmatimonadota bacterium]
MSQSRGEWKSKLGFILAASGSAIGLGNIVFFSANAYRFGAGAFYIPYLIALFALGIPIMILELGIGHRARKAFPEALYEIAGVKGEWIGWFGLLNAAVITMYYITILGWVFGMWIGSFGSLWEPRPVPAFGLESGTLSNSMSFFFDMISKYDAVGYVMLVWFLNGLIVWWGTKSIERAVKVFVPLMWLFMIVLILRGLTLPHGTNGLLLLFTPDFEVMKDINVWQGAFSQIFFTLSLGFGIMATYASYLPKKTDQTSNALTISFLNCSFEFIAGLAIFSLLFCFAVVPSASTLSMTFFVIPEGIGSFPVGVKLFGILFYTLLLTAGLTSSVSLVEGIGAGIIDKFGIGRRPVVLTICVIGAIGSVAFALPKVIDPGLANDGTLGLTLLDMFDHWAFSYGLLICGFLECVLVGWVLGADKLRAWIDQNAFIKLHPFFDVMIKWVIPIVILFIVVVSIVQESTSGGIYGHNFVVGENRNLHIFVLAMWIIFTVFGAMILTGAGGFRPRKKTGRLLDKEEQE